MSDNLEAEIKQLVVKACRLSIAPESLSSDAVLFGQGGINLDSIDALQIVVAIARDYGIDVPEEKMPELITINRITEFVASFEDNKSIA